MILTKKRSTHKKVINLSKRLDRRVLMT